MPGIGHAQPPLIRGAAWGLLGGLAALAPALVLWGYTVDDALISVRYAHHLALGQGWRFNAGGPATDGVTPLAWPLLLAPVARAAPLVVLGRAKLVGLCASLVTAVAVGRRVGGAGEAPVWLRAAILGVLSLSVPLAAYSVSGMETPLATLLATAAALRMTKPWVAACLAGAAATLRPELAPWAFFLASGAALASGERGSRVLAAGLLALAPFSACALLRWVEFGRAAPLAVLAKPSDLAHGLAYVGAAVVVSLAAVLVLAPKALARSHEALVIVVAATVHLIALAIVGGDWMPFARLVVPVLPSLLLAAALVGEHAHRAASAARATVAIVLGLGLDFGFRGVVADARHVGEDRAALIASAKPVLGAMSRVAALDVGWVGAATDADIVDLAGLTDPLIAALPGGHTSKQVGVILLLERETDGVVLYAPAGLGDEGLAGWANATYGRTVEQRLAWDPVLARRFAPAAWLPLGHRGAGYVVLRAVR